MKIVNEIIKLMIEPNGYSKMTQDHRSYMISHGHEILEAFKKYLNDNDNLSKRYRYLITFTVNTKLNTLPYSEVKKYIVKQLNRKPLKIVRAYIVEEGFENPDKSKGQKHKHYHVAIESTKFIKKNRFNYYIKKIGNIDVSKTKLDSLEEAINYISKDSTPEIVLDLTKDN